MTMMTMMSKDYVETDAGGGGANGSGRLVIAGTGILALAHMTAESVAQIRSADIIFYHATNGVSATQIRNLNPNSVDLYSYYGEGKVRTNTYVQMAELMLREVRRGRYVVGLFHGHPGFFVKAGRRALAIARIEGYRTKLLPGISTPDCLLADLRIDPGVIGVQVMKASHVLRRDIQIATNNHLILLQVSSVGDNRFSYTGYKNAKPDELFSRLVEIYGEDHESVHYVAAILPGFDPTITVRKLADYRQLDVYDTVCAPTLYLPPKGVRLNELLGLQAFDGTEPYGPDEAAMIEELESYPTPAEYTKRGASSAMMGVMEQLANSTLACFQYRSSPEKFLSGHPNLSKKEHGALLRRSVREMRDVTSETSVQPVAESESTNGKVEYPTPTQTKFPSESTGLDGNRLSMKWAADKQLIRIGNCEFSHEGPTATHPSHDLAHLLIAANGSLLWAPRGEKDAIKVAEYNAVFLEHLLSNTYNYVTRYDASLQNAFERTLQHARWFVEKHYAPFPLSPEEAYSQFCRKIDAAKMTALCPYYFEQKEIERGDSDFMLKAWEIAFDINARPIPRQAKAAEFQAMVDMHLRRMTSG